MADPMTLRRRALSPWAPLGESLFRSLWIASVISYTGTWMQNVGAGWLMTQMTMNPFMVGLVQAAGALPVFLVILPAGALADMVDRRRFLLVTQGWMVLASATLGILTLTSCVRSEEHTSELQSPDHLVCRLLLEKKKTFLKCRSTTRKIWSWDSHVWTGGR